MNEIAIRIARSMYNSFDTNGNIDITASGSPILDDDVDHDLWSYCVHETMAGRFKVEE